MTTTLLRGRLQVQVLPGSPEKPLHFNTLAAPGLCCQRHPRTISHERDGNLRRGAYKPRTGRSRSVAHVARWGGRQQPSLSGGLRCKPRAIGPERAQGVTARGANGRAGE